MEPSGRKKLADCCGSLFQAVYSELESVVWSRAYFIVYSEVMMFVFGLIIRIVSP